jgi:hypothetical protein
MGLALVALALGAAPVDWITICYGDDGHVSFEPSVAGRCVSQDHGSGNAAPHAGARGLASADPCCGRCTDVVAPSGQRLERVPAPRRVAAYGMPCLPAGRVAPLRKAAAPLVLAAATPGRRSVSTGTVLRC